MVNQTMGLTSAQRWSAAHRKCLRSLTDKASVYGTEKWGFESLRGHATQFGLLVNWYHIALSKQSSGFDSRTARNTSYKRRR